MGNVIKVSGIIREGYGVASGKSKEGRYPDGTIAIQKPHFKERGLNIDKFFSGTLNIDISPYSFQVIAPKYHLEDVDWIKSHQPETFSFCDCTIVYKEKRVEALTYYPSPETKEVHFQKPYMLEVLAPQIEELSYGDSVEIELVSSQITLEKSSI